MKPEITLLPSHRPSAVLAVCALVWLIFAATAQAQDLGVGIQLFNDGCAHCHGANGQGGVLAPSLLKRVATDDNAALTAFLKAGNPAKGMPPTALTENQYPELLGYLRYLSENVSDASYSNDSSRNQYSSMPAIKDYRPVTDQMLLDPDDSDWLWYSRTPDAQRFSPLDQINRSNVKQLGLAWSRGLPAGLTETIPTVHDGVMYLTLPGSNVAALDATTGDTIWEYKRDYANRGAGGSGRSKTLALYQDMVYFAAPDEMLVALDAKTGAVRWEAPTTAGRGNTTGAIVAEGVVVTSGTCRTHAACTITGHDALTGELKWTFMLAQEPGDVNPDSWADLPTDKRRVASWGLPGGYDAQTRTLFWSVANPSPYTRLERHGNADAIPTTAPADLYSDSTLALDAQTGKLKWYYQHLPGDDWDEDMNEERLIIRTKVNPDPRHVKWISSTLPEGGETRDIVVNVGEGGGIWALDKHDGQFLWASPFPFDHPNFLISDIDADTGRAVINRELVVDAPGAHRIVCFFNARSYWPGAYSPRTNSLYMPYINNCLNMTAASPATETMPAQPESRIGIPAPGMPLDELNGLAKINMETGEITHWVTGRIPTNSSILATAGDLIFWGDINRRFRAQDAQTGQVLWETIVGGPVSTSNITYAVNGRQYVAVITGNNLAHPGINTGTMGPIRLNLDNSPDSNTVYVFALPQ
ncbi:MAG: PQQ-binding-like beta-propeller repeat protein [Nevskiaceae bacterium]|nr:PQQ-binding-like beta-propeller repeat protein [Nevskiaceae bacterium]